MSKQRRGESYYETERSGKNWGGVHSLQLGGLLYPSLSDCYGSLSSEIFRSAEQDSFAKRV